MEKKDDVEIDLIDLFYYLKKRIIIIIATAMAAAAIGLVVTQLFIAPEYTASTRMYVLNRANESSVAYSDFQTSTQMLNDYKVLITGRNVTDEVISNLGLNMTSGQLAHAITVTSPDNTRIVQIDVVDTDPQRAADIANAIYRIASKQIQTFMKADAVSLVYAAKVPVSPSSPSLSRNVIISAALGLVIALGVLVVIYILDDTIRTEDDVERYLGLGTLGVIPISEELGIRNKANKAKRIRLNFKK